MACLNSSEAEQTFKNKHVKRALKLKHRPGYPACAVKINIPISIKNFEVNRGISMGTSIVIFCILVVVTAPAIEAQDLDLEASVSVNKPARNVSEAQPWVHFSPGM